MPGPARGTDIRFSYFSFAFSILALALGCSREAPTGVSPRAGTTGASFKSIPAFDDDSPMPKMRRIPIFTAETDPVGVWQPRTRLNFASSQFAESLRTRNRDLSKSQFFMIESAHFVRDQLQSASQRLEEEDKLFAIESIYQQACVYAETKHFDYAFDALKVAVKLGFCDERRIQTKFGRSDFQNDERFTSLLESIQASQEKEIEFRIRLALEGFAPFAIELPPMISVDNIEFSLGQSPMHFFFCMGMSYEPCVEMLTVIEELRLQWKDSAIEFSGILFETQARRRDLVAIKKFVDSKSIRFPVYIADPEHFLAFRGLAAFPAVVIVDGEGIVRAAISYHQCSDVLNGILRAVMKEKSPS